jgi:hypothetical protein
MVAESTPHRDPDVRKRRSTRIVQAVPLSVTGVDALGRPFQERTSTLIINCHGCRYQSKHYVLKNMWVTLETPHPEVGRGPRTVRGRVTWIQRPRTVRELFQVGIEMEVPGNIWGIAFPPPDWFPFPDPAAAQPAEAAGAESDAASGNADWSAEAETAQGDNLVVMGKGNGGDASLSLARQVARLVVEAKKQIQASVREAASKSISHETQQALSAIGAHVNDAATRAVQESIEAHSKTWQERAERRVEEQTRAAFEKLREEMRREANARMEEARQAAASSATEQELQHQAAATSLGANIESEWLRLRESAEMAAARADAATAQLERVQQQLEKSLQEMNQRAAQSASDATHGANIETTLTRLRESAEAATARAEAVNAKIESAQQQLAQSVEVANQRAGQIVSETALNANLEATLTRLRESAEAATARAEAASAKIETSQQQLARSVEEANQRAGQIASETTLNANVEATLTKLKESAEVAAARALAVTAQLERAQQQFADEAKQRSAQVEAETTDRAGIEAALGRLQQAAEAAAQRAETATSQLERMQQQFAEGASQHASRVAAETEFSANVESSLARLRESADAATARAEAAVAQLEGGRQQFAESLAAVSQRVEQTIIERTQDVNPRIEEFRSKVEALTTGLQEAITQSENDWRARLEARRADAQRVWDTQVTTSLEQAVQLAAARIAAQGRQDAGRLRGEADSQLATLRREMDGLQAQATNTLNNLQAQLHEEVERAKGSVAEVQQAAERVADVKSQIEGMRQTATQELEQHLRDALQTSAQEFDGRLESAIAESAERIQPVVEAAEAQSVAWLNTKLEQDLAPHLARAAEAVTRIEASQQRAEEALRSHQDQLWQAAERSIHETTLRMQQGTEKVQKDWQEVARTMIDKWLGEIETRATETTHSTIESLYKSAGWYEKKVQTQMQATMEKGLEQASEALHVKAGEVSGLFATELDHYSRSFVGHAHSQLEEAGKSAVARAEQKLHDAVESTGAEISGRAREAAQAELDRFSTGLRSAFDQSTAHLEAHTAQVQAQIAFDARQLLADFQRNLAQQSRENVAAASRQLEEHTAAALESVRGGREMHEREFGARLEQTLTETLEAYKTRLENTSNAWLLSTASSLNQQAEQQIEMLARDAEQRLRDVFAQVFMNVGNLLRERPLDLSAMLRPAGGNAPEQK